MINKYQIARPGGHDGRKRGNMSRYQIVYSKRGYPLTAWEDNADTARKFADGLRRDGYSVDVWEHTKDEARKTNL